MTKTEAKLAGLQIIDNFRSLMPDELLRIGDTVFVSVMPELLVDGPYRVIKFEFGKILVEPKFITNDSFPVVVVRKSLLKVLDDDEN